MLYKEFIVIICWNISVWHKEKTKIELFSTKSMLTSPIRHLKIPKYKQ